MTKKRKSDWLTNSRKKLVFGDVISGAPETSSKSGRVRTKTENGVTYMWDTSENKWVRATISQAKSSNKAGAKKKEVSAREKSQNQAQGSSAKDQQGNIKSTTKAKAQPKKPAKSSEKETTSKTASNLSRGNIDKSLRTTGSVNVGSLKSESSTGNKRADRITSRAKNRAANITDRRAKKATKSARKDAVKSARRAGRDMIREAKGKEPRKKAMLGMLAGPVAGMAANAMQNSDNPTMQKVGKGLGAVSSVAGALGGGPSAGPPAAARKGMMRKQGGGEGKTYTPLTGDARAAAESNASKGSGKSLVYDEKRSTATGKDSFRPANEQTVHYMKNKEGEFSGETGKARKAGKAGFLAKKKAEKPSKVSKKLKKLEKMSTTPVKGPAIGGLFKKGGMKDRRKRRR